MNVAIIGYGIEGKTALDYWQKLGHQITICDQNSAIDKEIPDKINRQVGPNYLQNLSRFDLIVRSAGVNPSIILDENPDVKTKITTVINEFFRVCPTKNIIGVTGTKGKGTTSTLIFELLKAAGKNVFLGGNIGVNPLKFLPELTKESFVVLELSSFQLTDCKYSPNLAVCLMVVPEHLNWHTDMDDYILAKANLFRYQQKDDYAIYFDGNNLSKKIASFSQGHKLPFFAQPGAYIFNDWITIQDKNICQTSELQLIGEHNWQNVCAALTAVWQITKDVEKIREVLIHFQGLPNRLEAIRRVDNITYYNDSFAATPDAAIAALRAIAGPKIIILGGFDRHLPINHLAQELLNSRHQIRKAILIGESAKRLASECDKTGFNNYLIDDSKIMSKIVNKAKTLAISGDSVILSPGFASFDMFKNFEERGDKFRQAVNRL